MERNLIGELNIMKEAGIKPNFSEVGRRYGVDRHTVARYWNGGGAQPGDGRSGRRSGFDPYAAEIEGRAQLPGVTAKGIHEWLLDRHAGAEPPLPGHDALTHWMRARGVAVGEPRDAEAHPRFETAPGEQLQFDWKEDLLMHGRDGAGHAFNVFSATLGFSRLHVFARTPTRTRDDLPGCMLLTIAFLGGVCRLWLTDDMSAVVTVGAGGATPGSTGSPARPASSSRRAARGRPDQGQGRERQPLPLQARGLRGRLRRLGRARRDNRAHTAPRQRGAQRHHGPAAAAAVRPQGEEGARARGQHAAAG